MQIIKNTPKVIYVTQMLNEEVGRLLTANIVVQRYDKDLIAIGRSPAFSSTGLFNHTISFTKVEIISLKDTYSLFPTKSYPDQIKPICLMKSGEIGIIMDHKDYKNLIVQMHNSDLLILNTAEQHKNWFGNPDNWMDTNILIINPRYIYKYL